MLILLFVLMVILTVVFDLMYKIFSFDEIYDVLSFLATLFGLGFLILIIIFTFKVTKDFKIDSIIAMYEEENTSIENHMNDLVKGYMDYESNTLEKFTPESSITLVSLYPELKSDELVKQQIEIYLNNNKKIKELKEKQIYASMYRWWLYFGK